MTGKRRRHGVRQPGPRRFSPAAGRTVGDGIHAAFLLPEGALRATLEMQQPRIDVNMRRGPGDVSMRIGLHGGSRIAATRNQQLDYYGEAVNMAARMEGRGEAGDITLSAGFVEDPATSAIPQAKPRDAGR
jgi:class 3 adenylate cyclase